MVVPSYFVAEPLSACSVPAYNSLLLTISPVFWGRTNCRWGSTSPETSQLSEHWRYVLRERFRNRCSRLPTASYARTAPNCCAMSSTSRSASSDRFASRQNGVARRRLAVNNVSANRAVLRSVCLR